MNFWTDFGGFEHYFTAGVILVVLYLVSCIYKGVLICSKEKPVEKGEKEGVSIVITANNKAEYIRENLEFFLKQEYPQFEVIVVDECSEDDTQEILSDMSGNYPHLRSTRIFPGAKFRNTKKLAINLGVLAAKYDIILFSEISCRPTDENWLTKMESYFDKKTTAVIGYANYEEKRGVDIPRFYRFLHFLELIFLTKNRCFVQGQGLNMGWRKKDFLEQKVFYKNAQTFSGYDKEIVRSLSKKGKVRVNRETEASIKLDAIARRKWGESMAYYYYNKRQWSFFETIRTNYDLVLRWLIYLFCFHLIIRNILVNYAILFILFTFLLNFISLNVCLKKMKQKRLVFTSLIACFVGFLYRWYYSIYSVITHKKWR